jgi:hypothetical protein
MNWQASSRDWVIGGEARHDEESCIEEGAKATECGAGLRGHFPDTVWTIRQGAHLLQETADTVCSIAKESD